MTHTTSTTQHLEVACLSLSRVPFAYLGNHTQAGRTNISLVLACGIWTLALLNETNNTISKGPCSTAPWREFNWVLYEARGPLRRRAGGWFALWRRAEGNTKIVLFNQWEGNSTVGHSVNSCAKHYTPLRCSNIFSSS